ncbi:HNH endonuclease [Paenibacillus physcomitrellae]|nr:HNH endonuclease signature motif containing protein [Paenibacillus physcomitrellae]
MKMCMFCKQLKPVQDFRRRTGRRAGAGSRRGPCRDCRELQRKEEKERKQLGGPDSQKLQEASTLLQPGRQQERSQIGVPDQAGNAQSLTRAGRAAGANRPNQPAKPQKQTKSTAESVYQAKTQSNPKPNPKPKPKNKQLPAGQPAQEDVQQLKPMRSGMVRMRGKSDKGRRWQQEIELELARLLVQEHAAVIVNRHTIRRLFTNREFKHFILERDHYTCHFCGGYGDTIDHLLPRAKGGHTTPLNCVCACNACNQSKADRDLEDFMSSVVAPHK